MNNLVDIYLNETWSTRTLLKAVAKSKKQNMASKERLRKAIDEYRAMRKSEKMATEGVSSVHNRAATFAKRAIKRNLVHNLFRKKKKSIIGDARDLLKKDKLKKAKVLEKAHKVEAKKTAKEVAKKAAKLAKEEKNKAYYKDRAERVSKLRDGILDLDRRSY